MKNIHSKNKDIKIIPEFKGNTSLFQKNHFSDKFYDRYVRNNELNYKQFFIRKIKNPPKKRKNIYDESSELIENTSDISKNKKVCLCKYMNKIFLKYFKLGIGTEFKKISNKNSKKRKKTNNIKTNYDNKSQNILLYLNLIFIICTMIYFFIYKLLLKEKKQNDSFGNSTNIYDDEKIYNKTLNDIIKMKKVVYTVNFGNYDKLKKINKQEGYDYFAFLDTDIDKYKDTNWTIIPVSEEINNLNVSYLKKTRFIKLYPHLFFKNYSLSIYIDAAYEIKGDLNEFLLRILEPKYNIYSLEHFGRDCIYQEIERVVQLKKEKLSIAQIVYDKYKKENFPKRLGLSENCLIIRKHNEKEIITLMEKWWEEIKNYSYRDQLSFNYVLWKTGIKTKFIPKYFASQYFNLELTHLITNIIE